MQKYDTYKEYSNEETYEDTEEAATLMCGQLLICGLVLLIFICGYLYYIHHK